MNGIIVLNKEEGITSNRVLQQVKRLFNIKKVGHTGTLDPMATGILPICVNEATKFSKFITESKKEYKAIIQLGITTDSFDKTGKTITKADYSKVSVQKINELLPQFTGVQWQKPPLYSAIKVAGKRLYEYAYNGEEVVIPTRRITIYNIKIEKIEIPFISISIVCSKGTYIRSLAHDIGMALECGACLFSLQRTQHANIKYQDAYTLQQLQQESLKSIILPVDYCLCDMSIIHIKEDDYQQYVHYGHQFNTTHSVKESRIVRLYYKDNFIGIGTHKHNMVQPNRLIVNNNI